MKRLIFILLILGLSITSISAQGSGKLHGNDHNATRKALNDNMHARNAIIKKFADHLQQNKVETKIEVNSVDYQRSCSLEEGDCEARYTFYLDNQKIQAVGSNGAMGSSKHENIKRGTVALGQFKTGDVLNLRVDIWEDDAGDPWEKDSNWAMSDDDYPDLTHTITIDSVNVENLYVENSKGIIKQSFTIGDCPVIKGEVILTIDNCTSCFSEPNNADYYNSIKAEMKRLSDSM